MLARVMLGVTVPQIKPIAKRELQRRLRRLGISQNELARRIGRNPAFLSQVIHRKIISRPVWERVHSVLAELEQQASTPA